MCVSRASLNFCKCGCLESEHEQPSVMDSMLGAEHNFHISVGKCNGQRVLPLSIEDIQAAVARGEKPVLTEPCKCPKFEPIFKNECGGF